MAEFEQSIHEIDSSLVIDVEPDLDNLELAREISLERTPENHEALITRLSGDVDPCERTFAATSLGYLAPADPELIVPALEMAALDPSENVFVIEAALRSIAEYKDLAQHAAPSVKSLLSHRSVIVRVAAVKALSVMGLPAEQVQESLGSLIRDASLGVRKQVMRSLKSGGKELKPLVIDMVDLLRSGEGDKTLVIDLIDTASRVGQDNFEVARAVADRLNDTELEVRLAAVRNLGLLGRNAISAGPEVGSILANPLENFELRLEAALTLKILHFKDRDLLYDLMRVVEEEIVENDIERIALGVGLKREAIELIGEYREEGIAAVALLHNILRGDELVLASAAADALAKLGQNGVDVLLNALEIRDFPSTLAVIKAIQRVIRKLKGPVKYKVISLLKQKLAQTEELETINAILVSLGTIGIDACIASKEIQHVLITSSELTTKMDAIWALGEMCDPDAVQLLQQYTKDENFHVARSATQALQSIEFSAHQRAV